MPVNCHVLFRDRFVPKVTLFEQRGYLVGRDRKCEIVLEHSDVSRRHAHIYFDSEHWQVKDLNSTNGLYLDSQRQTGFKLSEPTVVTLGSLNLQLTPISHSELTTDINHAAWLQKRARSALAQCVNERSVETMLISAQRTVNSLLNSDRAALIFLGSSGSIKACRGYPDWLDSGSFDGSSTLIWEAVKSGIPVAANNAQTHQHLKHQPSVQSSRIKAAIACPVMQAGQVIAVFYADSLSEHHHFSQQDIELLQAYSRQLALHLALKNIDDQLEHLESHLSQRYA
ncbi:MAG: hypothetical protein CMF11_00665 [Idiomarina sp.]|nr:hypothetical protein [Idiomarina sp.]